MASITVKQIDALTCTGNQGKRYVGADGLYLLIRPSNKRPGKFDKYWRYDYKLDGKGRTASYGVYPRIGLKEAQAKHFELKKKLDAGIDPAEERRKAKLIKRIAGENTLQSVCEAWLKTKATWADSHRVKVVLRLENDVYPALGKQPIVELSAPELFAVLETIQERAAVDSAHRSRAILSQVFRFGIVRGLTKDNPAEHVIGQLNSVKKQSYPHITDPVRLGQLLRAIDAYDNNPVKLSPLVFLRPGELRGALWEEIDLDSSAWRIPAARMKKKTSNHIVPLSTQAVEVLTGVMPFRSTQGHVFPSPRGQGRTISINTLNTSLRAMGFTKEEHCMHGWRHTASTFLNEWQAVNPDLIETQLHHLDPSIRARYNKADYLEQRGEMMQQWADYLDELRAEN